jgi:hypothetical protein
MVDFRGYSGSSIVSTLETCFPFHHAVLIGHFDARDEQQTFEAAISIALDATEDFTRARRHLDHGATRGNVIAFSGNSQTALGTFEYASPPGTRFEP